MSLSADEAMQVGLRRQYDDLAKHRTWLLDQVDYCNRTLAELVQRMQREGAWPDR